MDKKERLSSPRLSSSGSAGLSVTHVQHVISQSPVLSSLLERVKKEMCMEDASHDLQHLFRVAMWTIRLNSDGCIQDNIAAALLHDIVNVPKNDTLSKKASELSASKAKEILISLSYQEDHIDSICLAILQHSFSRGETPTTDLGKALQDADRLDALGVLGVFRCISCGTRMGASFFHPTDPWWKERELDDRAYSIDHFPKKLFLIKEMMNTAIGRAEAEVRTERMVQMLTDLGDEIGYPYIY